jgi:glucose-6-phosphate isomerase
MSLAKPAQFEDALLGPLDPISLRMPILLQTQVGKTIENWKKENKIQRLWKKDPSLWTHQGEEKWLGWLDEVKTQLAHLEELKSFQKEISFAGYRHAVVLGMGGSSLCAEVLEASFDPVETFPDLYILDSTQPDQIRELETHLELSKTLFIVSSKSGGTLETGLYFDYFYEKMIAEVGSAHAGSHFVAITDPQSGLETLARSRSVRRVFYGVPGIGGRYSALSNFGMIPAAVLGLDIEDFLNRAQAFVEACQSSSPIENNPAFLLGAALGTLGAMGRNKVTLICSPELWDFSPWIEQILAESTGKLGKGLIPISESGVGSTEVYGDDRLFVYLKLEGSMDPDLDNKISSLVDAQFPVVEIQMNGCVDLGQEFFRWEFATAVAGSILQINPFDQPDVEAAKIKAKELMTEFEKKGSLPKKKPLIEEDGIAIYSNELTSIHSVSDAIATHMGKIKNNDYFGILAYIPMSLTVDEPLDEILRMVRDHKKVACCLGYGPRYLHSTGQDYKGGPNQGVFLQITTTPVADLPIPGRKYSFGTVNAAQAQGDLDALAERKRRLMRVHIEGDLLKGLSRIKLLIQNALQNGMPKESL